MVARNIEMANSSSQTNLTLVCFYLQDYCSYVTGFTQFHKCLTCTFELTCGVTSVYPEHLYILNTFPSNNYYIHVILYTSD